MDVYIFLSCAVLTGFKYHVQLVRDRHHLRRCDIKIQYNKPC